MSDAVLTEAVTPGWKLVQQTGQGTVWDQPVWVHSCGTVKPIVCERDREAPRRCYGCEGEAMKGTAP